MVTDLISVIIPCFNVSEFISETLNSILSQKNVDIEIIIINDGSNDDTEQKIKSISDGRIKYFYQPNSGVSSARNNGFAKSTGKYVVFFDADDIMSEDFLYSRLINIGSYDFVCGQVKKFTNQSSINPEIYRGTSSNLMSEILLYNPQVITCPSNYLFKSNFLKQHALKFNNSLSSTADRYFLLECAINGKSEFISKCSELLYRVNQNSMSHLLTKKLVNDNALYYELIQKNNLIPSELKVKSLFLGYYILSGANFKVKNVFGSLKYGFMALFMNPTYFIKKLFKQP